MLCVGMCEIRLDRVSGGVWKAGYGSILIEIE